MKERPANAPSTLPDATISLAGLTEAETMDVARRTAVSLFWMQYYCMRLSLSAVTAAGICQYSRTSGDILRRVGCVHSLLKYSPMQPSTYLLDRILPVITFPRPFASVEKSNYFCSVPRLFWMTISLCWVRANISYSNLWIQTSELDVIPQKTMGLGIYIINCDGGMWILGACDVVCHDQQYKMKIYLLVLALAVLAHSTFRHLRNLTLSVPAAPLVKSLSPNEVVIQYQDTIVVYDIIQNKELQNIQQDASAPVQYVSSANALIYPNGNDIKQVRSNSKSNNKTLALDKSEWIPDIGVYGSDVVVAKFGDAGKSKILNIYGTGSDPWDITNIIWNGSQGENVKGGSGVSLLAQNEFYFAAGGSCNGQNGQILLQQGSRAGIQNIFNFTFNECNFEKENKDWHLKSYNFNDSKYHLLTYAVSSANPRRFTTQLISNANGKYEEVVHFEVEYQIGAAVYSPTVLYTADNLLCRVLQHDIANHEHRHHPDSAFKFPPSRTYVNPSEKYVTTISQFKALDRIVLYQFDAYYRPQFRDSASPKGNAIRGQIVADNYLIVSSDGQGRPLSLFNIDSTGLPRQIKINVVDFCVSSDNIIFVIELNDNGQTLSAYTLDDTGKLVPTSDTINLNYNVSQISCLNKNNVFLDPLYGAEFQVYYLNNNILSKIGSLKKDRKLHEYFAYTNQALIFTNSSSDHSLFYNYQFTQLTFSWNLPEKSIFTVIQAKQNHVILAVGDDLEHLVSLQLYKIQNGALTYEGTYPYFDDGEVLLDNIILLPKSNVLHIQYATNIQKWSTRFDLSAPPIKSIGYFYNADKTCSDFDDAIFHFTPTSNQLIFLNKYAGPSLERYAIKDSSLKKIESVPINFQSIGLSLKQSANKKELVISGISCNLKYAVQVRNINLLSKVIYQDEKETFAKSLSLQSAEISNQLIVSAFIDKQQDGSVNSKLYFDINTNHPIAANTDIFTKITLLAACPKCSRITFTGTLKTPLIDESTIVIQDFQSPLNPKYFDTVCQINMLALSPSGKAVAYSCINNTIFVQGITPLSLSKTYTKITELSFLDENTIIANLDDKVVTIPINASRVLKTNVKAVSAVSGYTINYNRQIYAVAASEFSVQIYNTTTGLLIDTIPIKSTDPISSMSFNSNDDLIVATTVGTIILLTQIPCGKDYNFDGYFCLCKQLFVQKNDQCTCNYAYDINNGNCNCYDGYYFAGGNNCDSCSAICTTCSSGGAFSCDQFRVWFYVIIIASILIVASGVLVAVFKLRKREKQETMYTKERSKLSQRFVSDNLDGSKNKIDQ